MGAAAVFIPGVEVLEELGRGAHNAVYRVRRRGRYYAAKVPLERPGSADADLAARQFVREAVALARIHHRVLPRVMEVGHAGKQPYLIMELAAGETLAERLRSGPLQEPQVRELASELTDALARIHECGLVHRDIKASNILFDSPTTAVRLVDFGLSSEPHESSGESDETSFPRLCETNDVRGDLFSLGCVLFQCLTGRVPFVGLDPAPLLERHGRGDEADFAPHVSLRFSRLLRKLLGLGGEAPYQEACSLLEELKQLDAPASSPVRSARAPRANVGTGAQVPLLGRERELECLRSARRNTLGGRTQVVLLRGGRGSGKTRLLGTFAAEVTSDGHACFSVSCTASERTPFAVVRQIIETFLEDQSASGPAKRLASVAKLRSVAGEMSPLLRLLSPKLARVFHDTAKLSRNDGASHIFTEGLAEFLGKLFAELGPTVLCVDDVQWLDAGSRRVLGRLSDRSSGRLLLALAARDDAESAGAIQPLAASLEPDRLWDVGLGPLDEDGIVEFTRAFIGHERPDPDLIRCVVGLSDGTPLSVLETLRSILDGGALVPYWGDWKFDSAAARRMGLPRGSLDLVARRISKLEAESVHVLSAAAVIGRSFDEALLSRVTGTAIERLRAIVADARPAMLLESLGDRTHRFVHDSVREALLQRLSSLEVSALHTRVAEALDERLQKLGGVVAVDNWLMPGSRSALLPDACSTPVEPNEEAETARVETLLALAAHYADGDRTRNPERILEACTAAGKLASRSFDNEPALRFFEVARQAAAALGKEPDLDLEFVMAETHLRTGSLDLGCAQLRRVVRLSQDPVVRAYALSRIAWAEMQSDTTRAWAALGDGFRALGMRPIAGGIGLAVAPVSAWVRRKVVRNEPARTPAERRRLTVVCELYHLAARLAADTGEKALMVQAVLGGLEPAERLGPSAALNKSYLGYSLLLTLLGAREPGRRYLRLAQDIAAEIRNPIVQAFTLQVHAVIAAWSGDIREALEVGARSLDEYGHWRDVGDYCMTAYNQEQIEGLRGRNLEGWKWLDRAIAKLSRHEGPPMVLDYLQASARAALTALGREQEADRLLARFEHLTGRAPARGNLPAYGSLVRLFTESGDLGTEFERLVDEVRAKKLDPRRVHLAFTEYYVHVAHARVHACLRAEHPTLAGCLEQLAEAVHDLELGARIPLLRAHVAAVRGFQQFLQGDRASAERSFDEAERLGREEGAPWVLWTVHRGRAHLLRASGREDEARDQARLAETLAREHGSAYRLRWIREEFSLKAPSLLTSGDSSSPSSSPTLTPHVGEAGAPPRNRPRGYLRSLVRVGQCTAKELAFEHQMAVVLDELLEVFRAGRALLFLTERRLHEERESPGNGNGSGNSDMPPDSSNGSEASNTLVLACTRNAAGQELADASHDEKLVDDLWTLGGLHAHDEGSLPSLGTVAQSEGRAIAATSLSVRGGRLGVLYIERALRHGAFTEADARLLSALAGQVPLVLELARSLRAREHAEQTLRSAEKLEAIGRLAGGIAHDFNNMLSVILAASAHMLATESAHRVADDVKTVQSAAERARDLTRQLLAFSRGQYLKPEVIDLNDLIRKLEPIFRALGKGDIDLDIRLEPDLCRVKADPAQIDQVLTNLVVNACDAMQSGGRLSIETSNVTVADARGRPRALAEGRYARVVVSDTGHGMDETTRAKAFEPFFTTKSDGNGLGLATAYGIVAQSGGHIELESQPGVGATFRIYLPETAQRVSMLPPAPTLGRAPGGNETILVVDDEPLVRESTRRMLSSLGYRVYTAKNSEEALRIAGEELDRIDLVISDVIMPGMNGLELARELSKLRPSVRVLFVSGFTAGVLAERGLFRESVDFLQKPIAIDTLAARVRHLLDPPRADDRAAGV